MVSGNNVYYALKTTKSGNYLSVILLGIERRFQWVGIEEYRISRNLHTRYKFEDIFFSNNYCNLSLCTFFLSVKFKNRLAMC